MNFKENAQMQNLNATKYIFIPAQNPMSIIGEISRLMNTRLLAGETKNSLLQKSSRLIMIELAKNEGVTQLDLVKSTHLKAPTVSVTLQRLEKDGYIYRKTDSYDLRAVRVYLTEQGREFNRIVVERVRCEEDNILKCLTDSESKQLMKLLLKIRENMVEDCEKNLY